MPISENLLVNQNVSQKETFDEMGKTLICMVLLGWLMSLFGCAGTQSHLRILETDGTIRTDISDDASYDYKVFIENRIDFGWDGDNAEDRLRTVNLMFNDTCKDVKVLDQIPIKKGKYLVGRESVVWVMKVKCIK